MTQDVSFMDKTKTDHLSARQAAMLAALVAVGPLAIDTYLPAMPAVVKFFQHPQPVYSFL